MVCKPTDEELEQKVKELENKILELKGENRSLLEQLNISKTILSATPDLLVFKDSNFVYQAVNPHFCRFLDKPEQEIIGKTDFDLFPNTEAKMYRGDDARVMASGKLQVQNEEVTGAGGARRWLQVAKNPVIDGTGKSIGILCSVRDITGLRKSEIAFQESEDKLQSIFRAAPTGVGMVSDRVITQANERLCKILGYSKDELIGQSARMLYPDDEDFEYVGREKYTQIRDKGTGTVETRWQRKDGKVIDVLLSSTPLDLNDLSIGVTFTALDITDRKKAAKALRESEEKYRLLADNVTDVIWVRDMNLDLTYVSPSITHQTGYTVEETIARTLEETLTPGSFKLSGEVFSEELEIERGKQKDTQRTRTIEVEINCKDGSAIWTEIKMSFLRDRNEKPIGIIGISRDITKRRKTAEVLQESEERFRETVELLPSIVCEYDTKGRFTYINTYGLEAFGYTLSDLEQGLYAIQLFPPDEMESFKDRFSLLLKGEKTASYEYRLQHKDGSIIYIIANSAPIYKDGKIVGARSSITPINERKQAEEEKKKLESQLQHAQKMEAMGTLAGGIAHDFNNLLMGIQGRTSLMSINSDLSHPYIEHLKGIEDYVKSAADLTKQLLGFARSGKYEVKTTDLNDLLKNQNRMFGRTRKEIKIREKFEKNLWAVDIDQGQIEQVLLNIYVNAWQAMPGGGDLYVQTEKIIIDKEYNKPYQVEPRNYIKISITDTGVGMDEATRQRIFDPFFTTKEMGRGTGLGLASAYGIIKNHKGFIDVYSEKGEGTTFNIYLPASEKEAVKEKEIDVELIKGTETVLFVDDEDMIREIGQGIIGNLGYNALTAKSGKEAIEIYEKNRFRIDMVILDMIMPDMGGGETFDRLKEINPDIKVLLSSGYSINGQATEILERGCNGFIQKPFNITDLSKRIRKILDEE